MPRIIFTLPKELKKAIEKESRKLNISMSAFIRMTLSEVLIKEIKEYD